MVAALIAVAVLAGCSEEPGPSGPRKLAGSCGFPARKTPVAPDGIPEVFLLDGVEVSNVRNVKKRLTAALNVPHGVQEAFDLYTDAAKQAGYKIIQRDNEGFEAEIYMRRGDDLGAIQVRMSTCTDAVAVYLNVIRGAAAGVPSG